MTSNPVCPLCGNQDNQARFSQRGYKLCACNNCELLFIDPYPAEIDVVHKRVSDYSQHEMEIVDPEVDYLSSVLYYKKYLPMVENACEGAGSVLDVGCGTGYLLQQLGSSRSLYRRGIELNEGRAGIARNISGCEIHEIPIEQFKSQKKFDVIILMNVLSHMHSFDKLFGSLLSLLNDNGKLIFKVGEFSKQAKKTDIIDWEIPDHLHFLGHNTINYICQKYNLRIDTHERVSYSEYLFSRDRWMAPGRSQFRNTIKKFIVHTPFALKTLSIIFNLMRGRDAYSSFIVLSSKPK